MIWYVISWEKTLCPNPLIVSHCWSWTQSQVKSWQVHDCDTIHHPCLKISRPWLSSPAISPTEQCMYRDIRKCDQNDTNPNMDGVIVIVNISNADQLCVCVDFANFDLHRAILSHISYIITKQQILWFKYNSMALWHHIFFGGVIHPKFPAMTIWGALPQPRQSFSFHGVTDTGRKEHTGGAPWQHRFAKEARKIRSAPGGDASTYYTVNL